MREVSLIVIHCTATPNGRPVSLEAVDSWHRQRGFHGIGYHYLIGTDGRVDVGRDEEHPGAHAKGHNAYSMGVCLVGGVGGPDKHNPGLYTEAAWESLRIVVQDLMDRYPEARVVGHRDLSPDLDGDGEVEPHEWLKLCPAFEVRDWLAADMVAPSDQVLQDRYWPSGFYGRGFVQLTWEKNYRSTGQALGLDLVRHPELALDPQHAARILAHYFRSMAVDAAAKGREWAKVRRLVNGGTHQLDLFLRHVAGLEEALRG